MQLCLFFKEELRDVREQLAVYEQSLGISSVGGMEADVSLDNNSGGKVTPRHQLPLFLDTGGGVLSTIAAGRRKQRRSSQSVSFATNLQDFEKRAVPQRPSSAVAAPLSSTWNYDGNEEVGATVSDDEVISTTPSRR